MLQILITIDTEIGELGKYRPDAFETFIEGKVDDKEVGYRFIMNILDKYNAKGEFFVDIYPYKQIGENKFALLCQNIIRKGHNVQLHTHPSMAFDKKRIYMHQYSLKEQIEILGLGKRKIKEWINKYPVAHRAGGYGINEDTFRALENIGIYYDNSYFYGNDNCKVYYDIKNVPFKVGNITEIPITVFKRITNRSFFSINICQREHFQKCDIKYGATEDEIKELISKSDNDINIILFFHSFNFLKLPYNFRTKRYGKISIDKKMMEKFENIIKWISLQNNCSFTTIDKLKINFSQKDICMQIFKRGSITKIIYNKFTNKILGSRKT